MSGLFAKAAALLIMRPAVSGDAAALPMPA
jgi:hypothetical protein